MSWRDRPRPNQSVSCQFALPVFDYTTCMFQSQTNLPNRIYQTTIGYPRLRVFRKTDFFYNDARKIITSRCFVVDPPRNHHAPGQPPRVAKSLPRCIQVQTEKAIFLVPHQFFRCRFLHHMNKMNMTTGRWHDGKMHQRCSFRRWSLTWQHVNTRTVISASHRCITVNSHRIKVSVLARHDFQGFLKTMFVPDGFCLAFPPRKEWNRVVKTIILNIFFRAF